MVAQARFEGQVAVVTGASRGIGEGMALRFAREGASVVVAANEDAVHEAGERIRSATDAKVLSLVVDVTDRSQVVGLYDQTMAEFGRVDISIQNAGVITIKKLAELTEEEWDLVLDVNAKGVFLCCQAAANAA